MENDPEPAHATQHTHTPVQCALQYISNLCGSVFFWLCTLRIFWKHWSWPSHHLYCNMPPINITLLLPFVSRFGVTADSTENSLKLPATKKYQCQIPGSNKWGVDALSVKVAPCISDDEMSLSEESSTVPGKNSPLLTFHSFTSNIAIEDCKVLNVNVDETKTHAL